MRRLFRAAVLVSVLVALSSPAAAQAEAVAVETSPIASFWLASGETRFGPLEFVGGFSMSAEASRFGQFSALRFLNAGSDFIGVADHGFWSFGTILRDADLAPIGIADFTMQPMVDDAGAVIGEKELIDAEGLEVENGVATVSFEREARVSEYTIDPEGMSGPLRNLDFLVPVHELRFNQGLETVVRGADGARIVFSERSIDGEGDIFAAIIEGPGAGVFKVARGDGFDITDGALLPDGDILLLERRFSIELGVAMRLRRIPREEIRAGGVADGSVLVEADLTYQIDNMEAVDVWRREDGAIMVSLMSDDNQNFLQRTLYLEFRLIDELSPALPARSP